MIARMIRYQALHTCSVLRWYDKITSTGVRDDTIVGKIKGKMHGSTKDISPISSTVLAHLLDGMQVLARVRCGSIHPYLRSFALSAVD